MNILAIETSCDETSVAIVHEGTHVLSCSIASSMKIHAETGGIIPENAARKQIEYMLPTLEDALFKAFDDHNYQENIKNKIDAIAVTVGPGLIGSLLVGIETAKTLAILYNKPLIPVNHIEAHIYATFLSENPPLFPLLALVVSGGHTDFVYMRSHGVFERIGGTRDDAAGEAFDKCARLIGLPYPGGPSISKAAQTFGEGHPDYKYDLFPRPMIHEDTVDVSFSGLKTAVSNLIKKENTHSKAELAAEVENAIVDTLIAKTEKAIKEKKVSSFVLCGGVSANTMLRLNMGLVHPIKQGKVSLHVPQIMYCTDNAAMIASAAFFNPKSIPPEEVSPNPELHF